jgi:transposase-like protein
MMEQNKTDIQAQGGAPTKYKASFAKQAYKLCLLGATMSELADFFNVSESTIYQWVKDYRRFSEALKGGKMKADAEVANSLYRRSTGYKFKETTFEKIGTKEETKDEKTITVDLFKTKVVEKELAPDVGAITMWLKNRQRAIWRDRFDFSMDLEKLSTDQLEALYKRIISGFTNEFKGDPPENE